MPLPKLPTLFPKYRSLPPCSSPYCHTHHPDPNPEHPHLHTLKVQLTSLLYRTLPNHQPKASKGLCDKCECEESRRTVKYRRAVSSREFGKRICPKGRMEGDRVEGGQQERTHSYITVNEGDDGGGGEVRSSLTPLAKQSLDPRDTDVETAHRRLEHESRKTPKPDGPNPTFAISAEQVLPAPVLEQPVQQHHVHWEPKAAAAPVIARTQSQRRHSSPPPRSGSLLQRVRREVGSLKRRASQKSRSKPSTERGRDATPTAPRRQVISVPIVQAGQQRSDFARRQQNSVVPPTEQTAPLAPRHPSILTPEADQSHIHPALRTRLPTPQFVRDHELPSSPDRPHPESKEAYIHPALRNPRPTLHRSPRMPLEAKVAPSTTRAIPIPPRQIHSLEPLRSLADFDPAVLRVAHSFPPAVSNFSRPPVSRALRPVAPGEKPASVAVAAGQDGEAPGLRSKGVVGNLEVEEGVPHFALGPARRPRFFLTEDTDAGIQGVINHVDSPATTPQHGGPIDETTVQGPLPWIETIQHPTAASSELVRPRLERHVTFSDTTEPDLEARHNPLKRMRARARRSPSPVPGIRSSSRPRNAVLGDVGNFEGVLVVPSPADTEADDGERHEASDQNDERQQSSSEDDRSVLRGGTPPAQSAAPQMQTQADGGPGAADSQPALASRPTSLTLPTYRTVEEWVSEQNRLNGEPDGRSTRRRSLSERPWRGAE